MVQMEQLTQKPAQALDPLDRIGWLSERSEELQLWCAANGRWRLAKAGQTIYFEDDAPDGLYGIGTGALDVEFAPESLQSSVTIRAQPGGWLGQEALLPQRTREISLIAPVDSQLFFVPRGALRTLLADRPHLWPEFYALSIMQKRALMEFLCEALSLSPDSRLARLLLRLSATDPTVAASQQDLCALLGMPRTSLRRSLKTLADAGAIQTGYGRIKVVDRVRLARMIEEP